MCNVPSRLMARRSTTLRAVPASVARPQLSRAGSSLRRPGGGWLAARQSSADGAPAESGAEEARQRIRIQVNQGITASRSAVEIVWLCNQW